MEQEPIPKVGVGVLIVRDDMVLLGKRKGSHGAQQYGGPGGHHDYGETLAETALREIKEECGEQFKVKILGMLYVSDLHTYMPKQYVDIGFLAEVVDGEPEVAEPNKLESWDWYPIDDLPQQLFGCMTAYVEAYRTGKNYFTFLAAEKVIKT